MLPVPSIRVPISSITCGTKYIPEVVVAVVDYPLGVSTYQYMVERHPNITLTQFMTWHPYARFNQLQYGDVVYVG